MNANGSSYGQSAPFRERSTASNPHERVSMAEEEPRPDVIGYGCKVRNANNSVRALTAGRLLTAMDGVLSSRVEAKARHGFPRQRGIPHDPSYGGSLFSELGGDVRARVRQTMPARAVLVLAEVQSVRWARIRGHCSRTGWDQIFSPAGPGPTVFLFVKNFWFIISQHLVPFVARALSRYSRLLTTFAIRTR